MMLARIRPVVRDALENLLLRLVAEAVERRHLPRLAGRFELLHGRDAKFVIQGFDLFRPKAGNAQHRHQARGDGRLQFVEVTEFSRGDEFGDLLLQRLADPFETREALLGHELFQRLGQPFNCSRAILIGARLEGIFTLQFQKGADLG